MKLIYASIIICLNFSLYANTCYKDLCKEDIVRDQFGWRGVVVSFIPSKDLVVVGLSHTPSTFNFPYKDLGQKVKCYKKICEGRQVRDANGKDVDVIEVFNHGLVLVFDESIDGNLLYNIEELSPNI